MKVRVIQNEITRAQRTDEMQMVKGRTKIMMVQAVGNVKSRSSVCASVQYENVWYSTNKHNIKFFFANNLYNQEEIILPNQWSLKMTSMSYFYIDTHYIHFSLRLPFFRFLPQFLFFTVYTCASRQSVFG